MPDYTQEQVDEMINNATKGLFTEEELNKRITAEVDRRVETGIQKGIETQRSKWEEEYSRKAKLSAEELAQEKINEQIKLMNDKEKAIQRKSNLIDAKDMLTNASIPKEHYSNFIDVLVTDNSETTTANVQNFINMFNDTKKDIEQKIKSEISNVKPPILGGTKVVNKEDFKKLTFSEKIKFKTEHPNEYKEYIK